MRLTKKKVLYYNVLKWQYFYDHPGETTLPDEGEYKIIKEFFCGCATCEYRKRGGDKSCKNCYFKKICEYEYRRWLNSCDIEESKKYSRIILEACKKMTVKDL